MLAANLPRQRGFTYNLTNDSGEILNTAINQNATLVSYLHQLRCRYAAKRDIIP